MEVQVLRCTTTSCSKPFEMMWVGVTREKSLRHDSVGPRHIEYRPVRSPASDPASVPGMLSRLLLVHHKSSIEIMKLVEKGEIRGCEMKIGGLWTEFLVTLGLLDAPLHNGSS